MKKLIFTVATVLIATLSAKAQNQAGAIIGLMSTNFIDDSETTNLIGFAAIGKHNLNKNVRVGANIGYYSKSESGLSLFSMPIMGLVEYQHNMDKLTPFGGVEVGINRIGLSLGAFGTYASNNLAIAPVVGVEYSLNNQLNALVNAKYNYIMTEGSSTTGIGFNVGVTYNIK